MENVFQTYRQMYKYKSEARINAGSSSLSLFSSFSHFLPSALGHLQDDSRILSSSLLLLTSKNCPFPSAGLPQWFLIASYVIAQGNGQLLFNHSPILTPHNTGGVAMNLNNGGAWGWFNSGQSVRHLKMVLGTVVIGRESVWGKRAVFWGYQCYLEIEKQEILVGTIINSN